jgi:uncharacterized protein (DUF433 family)
MATQVMYPHLEKPEGQSVRLQRLPRIRVAQIAMDYLAHGWSVEEMCRQHPYLTFPEAHAAMGYYFDNQQEIDSEIRAEWEKVEMDKVKAPASPFLVRMKAKGLL